MEQNNRSNMLNISKGGKSCYLTILHVSTDIAQIIIKKIPHTKMKACKNRKEFV